MNFRQPFILDVSLYLNINYENNLFFIMAVAINNDFIPVDVASIPVPYHTHPSPSPSIPTFTLRKRYQCVL